MIIALYNKHKDYIGVLIEKIVPHIGEYIQLPVPNTYTKGYIYEDFKVIKVSYLSVDDNSWNQIDIMVDTELTMDDVKNARSIE